MHPDIPTGVCQCGCGKPTTVAPRSKRASGAVKGLPYRYLRGHNRALTPVVAAPDASHISAFWANITKQDDCWVWQGRRNYKGYGRCRIAGQTFAHRAAYVLAVGAIAPGLFVCHACDNRACINPHHLFVGTALDNNRDRVAKGRSNRPARSSLAKLTESEVRDIRRRRLAGETVPSLASSFGVTERHIYNITSRRTWAEID